jgi:hypothetical protein
MVMQVVSFDADWNEIYLGTTRCDVFSAICPNSVPHAATKVEVHYRGKGSGTFGKNANISKELLKMF